jgi:hypothetical protein
MREIEESARDFQKLGTNLVYAGLQNFEPFQSPIAANSMIAESGGGVNRTSAVLECNGVHASKRPLKVTTD